MTRSDERGKMIKSKRKKLEAAGWRVGTAEDFLGLDAEEAAFVELKLGLSEQLKELRTKSGLSQVELAKRLGSSQSRVAKMEASDPTVSIDLLVKGLLAVGATPQLIGRAIAKPQPKRAGRVRTRGNAV
jgi:ribosome-binding protein aMBF1 (putative translation factor)